MTPRFSTSVLRVVFVFALAALALVGAQEGAARAADSAAGAGIDSQIAEGVSPRPDSADTRAELAEVQKQIAQLCARADEWAGKAAEYGQARLGAPQRLAEIEQEIASLQKRRAWTSTRRRPSRCWKPQADFARLVTKVEAAAVTVGDISGTVTRIRIRATWITGFDRKELVVPNKEFVSSKLGNWSLSDAILRVDVPVAFPQRDLHLRSTPRPAQAPGDEAGG